MPLSAEFAILGAIPLAIVLPVVWWFRRRRSDEIFTKVTPGEVPLPGMSDATRRIGGSGEYHGTIAVRFTPPDGMTPGLAGTVIDGRANVVDVSSTLIDLAVRGYFKIVAVGGGRGGSSGADQLTSERQRDRGEPSTATDWELVREDKAPGPELLSFERKLLSSLFPGRSTVLLSTLKGEFGMTMREVQVDLYREVVQRGWYRKHPLDRNRRLALLGVPLLLLGLVVGGAVIASASLRAKYGWFPLAVPAGLLVSAGLLFWGGRGRTPRTALGTAARIQTLGFKEYLTKAEANQIRFEEAADIFSRYLPYALIFGVADRWAKIFGEVAAKAHLAGVADAYFDLTWFDGLYLLDTLSDFAWNAAVISDLFDGDGAGLLDGLAGLDLDMDGFVDAVSGGLEGVASGMGDFLSSAGDLFDLGDGCGDGCDLGGCDF